MIMGCGRVGSEMTVQLSQAGHDVAIIDKRPDAFDRLPPGFKANTIVGLGFDRDVLEQAGIKEADGFIAVSSGDNSNIVSARIALEHYRVPKVVARIFDPRRAEIYERFNIPTVASVRWAAKQIQYLLFHGREELKESIAGGSLLQMQIRVPSHLVGKKIASVVEEGKVEVVAVERGGSGFLPVAGSTFQEGDIAHFLVDKDAMDRYEFLLEPEVE